HVDAAAERRCEQPPAQQLDAHDEKTGPAGDEIRREDLHGSPRKPLADGGKKRLAVGGDYAVDSEDLPPFLGGDEIRPRPLGTNRRPLPRSLSFALHCSVGASAFSALARPARFGPQ